MRNTIWLGRLPAFAAAVLMLRGTMPLVQAASTAADPTVVMTEKGAVRGTIRNGVRQFKGSLMPSRRSASCDLPCRASRRMERHAGYHGLQKPVSAGRALRHSEASDNEDCLYLNVTVPDAGKPQHGRKRAVIVWIMAARSSAAPARSIRSITSQSPATSSWCPSTTGLGSSASPPIPPSRPITMADMAWRISAPRCVG